MTNAFLPQEVIAAKRDGHTLRADEIDKIVAGITDGTVSEVQSAAFAMAVFFRGMDMNERVALTRAMATSGTIIDWSETGLDGPILDKHSTGGVGDKVSLILAPILAACGAYVPMISGRGLGHTGGTLDKLDSIPGYDTEPDLATFRHVVAEAGVAIIGQTEQLAPADKRLYAIRDVTATVESIPLITASILSKKLAAGLDALCMDVKFGSGAFAPTMEMAMDLAESIVTVGNNAGIRTSALLTDMNQILGRTAGNTLEILEAVDFLTGHARDCRLEEVTLALCTKLLVLGGLAQDEAEAMEKVNIALASGQAAERFAKMVSALGGPSNLLDQPRKLLPLAPVTLSVTPDHSGFVQSVDGRALGIAVVTLGGGRSCANQEIDHGVGLEEVMAIGEEVEVDTPLALVRAHDIATATRAAESVRVAMRIGDTAQRPGPIVAKHLDPR